MKAVRKGDSPTQEQIAHLKETVKPVDAPKVVVAEFKPRSRTKDAGPKVQDREEHGSGFADDTLETRSEAAWRKCC